MRENLLKECRVIDDHCTFSAEVHHIIAVNENRYEKLVRAVPAVITAISSSLSFQSPDNEIWQWLTVVAAITTVLASIFDFKKSYQSHIDAAKGFTILKHEARALVLAFHENMGDDELRSETRRLLDEYMNLVRSAPPTTTAAFNKARNHIESEGRHKSVESE